MSHRDRRHPRKDLPPLEIESLNASDLDLEELERRIEMAILVPSELGWLCGCNNECGNCPNLCDLCTSLCSGDSPGCTTFCDVNCGAVCDVNCGVVA